MTMNWDNIKYLFQIPLEWFKAISNKVFRAYGTNFIRVRNGEEGAMNIDVDPDTFAQAVMNVTGGGSGGGTVKSVDNIAPDANGNVPLGAIRSINENVYPDANGNVDLGLGVASVNGIMPDQNGDVDLGTITYSVNNITPDQNGNVNLGTIVNTVNGTSPDQNGNVNLGTIVNTVNGTSPDANGNVEVGTVRMVNGIVPVGGNVNLGNLVKGVDGVTQQDFGMLHLSAVRSVNGKHALAVNNYNVEVGTVRSVNGIEPDDDGNVAIDAGAVQAVDGIGPDNNGNVVINALKYGDLGNASSQHAVCPYLYSNSSFSGTLPNAVTELYGYTGCDSYATLDEYIDELGYIKEATLDDYVTNDSLIQALGDYVTGADLAQTLDDYVTDADLGDLAYLDAITVDGHTSNSGGVVSFGLAASKWLQSDANGHITTTDDEPVTIDPLSSGYLYSDNGQLKYKDDSYVTLSTNQTIAASKTFNGVQWFRDGSDDRTTIKGKDVYLIADFANPTLNLQCGGSTLTIGKAHLYSTITTNDMLELQADTVNVRGTNGICLHAAANTATLANPPDGNAPNDAIATVGFLRSGFVDLTTNQRVGGIKTFTREVNLSIDTDRDASTRTSGVQRNLAFISNSDQTFGRLGTQAYANGNNEMSMRVQKNSQAAWIRMQVSPSGDTNIHYRAATQVIRHSDTLADGNVQITPIMGGIDMYPNSSKTWGGYINFHYAGDTINDYTARLIDYRDYFLVKVPDDKKIRLEAAANNSELINQPTVTRSNKTSKAIATCGWVNTNVDTALNNLNLSQYAKTADLTGYVTTNTNQTITGTKTWQASGSANMTQVRPGQVLANFFSVLNNDSVWGGLRYYSGVGMEVFAMGGLVLNASTNGAKLQSPPTEYADDDCIATVGFVKNNNGKVKTVDGVEPDSNGNVDFGLAANSVVTTDGDGHLTTASSGVSATKKVVTGVSWNGTQLVINSETWTYQNGLLTSATANANETINTVTYN